MPYLPSTTKRPWIPERKPFEGCDRSFNYSNTQWKKLREIKKKKDPLCELCKKKGIVKEAQLIDHLISIRDGGEPLDINNLCSLCKDCHVIKTQKEIKDRRSGGKT